VYHFGKAQLPFQIVGCGLEFVTEEFKRCFRRLRPQPGHQGLHRQPVSGHRLRHEGKTRRATSGSERHAYKRRHRQR